ncbi:hypothetical protein [Planctopirus limnophila]|uniref:hypothetical protein n=1 Tax=Planctopirus limnophila TaxID=120 RepID=UPI00059BDCB5|nr:hypothetical protein [Planctopirus limnophila]
MSPEIHPTACQRFRAKWLTYCQFRLIPCPPNPNAEENQQQACTAEPMQTWQVSASKNEFTLKFSLTFQKSVTSEIQEGCKNRSWKLSRRVRWREFHSFGLLRDGIPSS